jgi:PAS domain S-box-containing protein
MLELPQVFARSILDSSLDMIIVIDERRRILEFNPAAQHAFGYRSEEMLGRSIDLLYVDQRFSAHSYATARQQGRYVHEVVNRRKDGTEFDSYCPHRSCAMAPATSSAS